MKRNHLILLTSAFFAIAICILPASSIYTNIVQPTAGGTPAPGEQSCGQSGCHTGNPVNLEVGKLALNSVASPSIASGYTPGTQYNLIVNMGTVQQSVKGFQITALDQNGNGAGTFTLTNVNSTSLNSSGNRQYVGHKNANTTSAWTFRWQAPATNIGPVTFYIAGVGANGDGNAGGDVVYEARAIATTTSFSQLDLTGIQPINVDDAKHIRVFPNPFSQRIGVDYFLETGTVVRMELMDAAGKSVAVLYESSETPGQHQHLFDLQQHVQQGLYLLKITEGERTYYKKLMAN